MKHDYLKSIDNNIYIVNTIINFKNKKIFCGYLDIELEPEKKETELISETGLIYLIDTDFSDGEIKYPCNQFNVRLNLKISTS
jgi:hypothetical protein